MSTWASLSGGDTPLFNHPRAADAKVAISVVATAISWLDVANQVVQLIAGLVAIVSGLLAAWYYIKSNRRIKEQPKDYGPED
jgi:hypothetical protein